MQFPIPSVEDAPLQTDLDALQERIDTYNMETTGRHDYRPLALFVRDDMGALVAGLSGFTWGGTLHVDYLWVREDQRQRGYARALLRAAEQEALARGCQQAVLDTHSFQAPDLYPRLGYSLCGVTPDYPVGHQHLHYQKRLPDSVAPGQG